jgi:hypothetical protein
MKDQIRSEHGNVLVGVLAGVAGVVLVVFVILGLIAMSNPTTPAGHEGYIRQGAFFGEARFHSVQQGPKSTGIGWLLSSQNVDVRWATADEQFSVMSRDDLSLTFKAHAVIRPMPGSVKELVETYGGQYWYGRFVKEPFRNVVYDSVSKFDALDAKNNRDKIADQAATRLRTYLKGKPFELQTLVIGTIGLPSVVANAQEAKIKKQTELAQKDFEIATAEKDAIIREKEALGIAKAQKIINETLTDRYLQHEAIMAQSKMAASPNHTTVYIPVGNNGIPVVRTVK